jgi:hypothetical protein
MKVVSDMNRRQFIVRSSSAAAGVSISLAIVRGKAVGASTESKGDGGDKFFTLSKRNGRWWLITPQGEPFFSIGLNHIDSASLRYVENQHIWRDRYGNSVRKWLEQVRADLVDWGFNTVGWVQEVVTREVRNHRHSRNFTYEEYQWLDMPYCHMLPFVDFHQWEVETINPDVKGKSFAEWCDYVARAHCGRFADDRKLIGYFYSDCPTWVHIRKDNAWKGPLFDPERLRSEAGRKELFDLARTYYRVTHDAVRRYDENHLILGDRYEARAPLPDEVVKAALPYVDVLSFQCFGGADVVQEKLGYWAERFDKPLLLADNANWRKGSPPQHGSYQNPVAYGQVMKTLREMSNCIGYHLCGAYIRNRVRRYGLRDGRNAIDLEAADGIRKVNEETAKWVKEQS